MKKIGEALDGFFETFGIKDDKNYLGFLGSWNELIGQDLASHTRPMDIRGTVLIIAVDHPGWMTRIRFEEKRLLKKLQKGFPQLGISALGFNMVDTLPKLASIAIEPAKTLVESENVGITSGKPGEKNFKDSEVTFETLNEDASSAGDFQTALKRLKAAMAEKGRNDR